MKNHLITPRLIFVASAILLAAASRFIPHAPNFTPVLAMGLFAGATLSSFWLALLIPCAAMLLSDAFIGFHGTMWGVYLATAIAVLLGYMIRNAQNFLTVTGMSFASAVLFFLLSNLAVWTNPATGAAYPQDLPGLLLCYEAALPFFRNTLFSNLLYAGALFGAFHLVREMVPSLIRVDNKKR